jgi:NADPH:quinone reductase-like Zn-dependent oxidoreductase
VFIAGCTGGVGHLAVQIAKSIGAKVIGSCNLEDFETAKTIGVDEVYDYSKINYHSIKCCQVVFDTSGKMSRKDVLALLPKGKFPFTVSGKFVDLNPKPLAMIRSLFSGVYKVVITNVNYNLIQSLEQLAFQNKIKPIIGRFFDFTQAVEVINEYEKGQIKSKGKIVFKI